MTSEHKEIIKEKIIDECLNMCDKLEHFASNRNDEDAKVIAKELSILESKIEEILEDTENKTNNVMSEEEWFEEITQKRIRPIVHWLEGVGINLFDDARKLKEK